MLLLLEDELPHGMQTILGQPSMYSTLYPHRQNGVGWLGQGTLLLELEFGPGGVPPLLLELVFGFLPVPPQVGQTALLLLEVPT